MPNTADGDDVVAARETVFGCAALRPDCVRATDAVQAVCDVLVPDLERRIMLLFCAVRALIAVRAVDGFGDCVVRAFC